LGVIYRRHSEYATSFDRLSTFPRDDLFALDFADNGVTKERVVLSCQMMTKSGLILCALAVISFVTAFGTVNSYGVGQRVLV
jgi:hypothetical protein